MKRVTFIVIGGAVLLAVGAFVVALFGGFPENPGDTSNPTFATVVQRALEQRLKTLPADEAERQRTWLRGVAEFSSRCTRGPVDESKNNRLEYFVTLTSGERIEDREPGRLCMYDVIDPLPMRVVFKNGEVDDVKTDGRERGWPTKDLSRYAEIAVSVVFEAATR